MSAVLKIEETFPTPTLAENRGNILRLEESIKALPPVEVPLSHTFAKGMYARTVLIPAGTVAVGKIHQHEHICVVAMGDITVATEHGVTRIQAPYMTISPPGTKRAVYAHTDTLWTTFHATEETDLEKLEAQLISPSYEALENTLKELTECLG